MNRQQWKDLAEAVGFAAIVASLVFVGIETRNSAKQSELQTQALEIAAYQALMSNIDEINALGLQSTEAAATMAKIWDGSASEPDRFQLDRMLYDSEIGREFWQKRKASFTENYRIHVEHMIADSAGSTLQD